MKIPFLHGLGVFLLIVSGPVSFAGIELVTPKEGSRSVLLPKNQVEVMSLATSAERQEWCRKHHETNGWRCSIPLRLEWRSTSGEKGPWRISIGKRKDLSDARTWYVSSERMDETVGKRGGAKDSGKGFFLAELPRVNLEIGLRYFWRVDCRGRCDYWGCGPLCTCTNSKNVTQSSIGSFCTDSTPPRWMALEGRVHNVRDLGGWMTEEGACVRQGMIYRGQGLNDNSVSGEVKGPNRLTVEDVAYLVGFLGIKTDLDLRAPYETADLQVSPMGKSVKFILRSSMCYRTLFNAEGKRVMAENFRVFCNPTNYPIYFHCIGGADRTGSLAYILNGLLGVSRHDLETDWEATFYPDLPELRPGGEWRREHHLTDGIAGYGDSSMPWRRRIELYLLDCGITKDEMDAFRKIMLKTIGNE